MSLHYIVLIDYACACDSVITPVLMKLGVSSLSHMCLCTNLRLITNAFRSNALLPFVKARTVMDAICFLTINGCASNICTFMFDVNGEHMRNHLP
jgi:hypothetical protein